ncbi:hypothetical protein GCM10023149_16170 [Mucilaginibacter gynuensis]|uniref:histidine kinase n=1 Tax=Mucilaginibacter gynuensis TaxID=1302236 RepID=A0ABP8G6P3_9SPHI
MPQTAVKTFLNLSGKGHWNFDVINKQLDLCPTCEHIFNISNGCASLSKIFDVLNGPQIRKLLRAYAYALSHQESIDMKFDIPSPDGRRRWLHLTGVLHYKQWDLPVQIVGTVEDVTQRVNEDALGLAVINHELRSPLTIIKLNNQLVLNMLTQKQEAHAVKLLKTVDDHVNGITQMLDDYLTYSADDKYVRRNNFSLFDLNKLLHEIILDVRTAHNRYLFDIGNRHPVFVRADRYKIIQVMINYITNAVKFSPEGSRIRVDVTIDDRQVTVGIKDQGVGIANGQEKVIFNKFHHTMDQRFRQRTSKGLGLYLVKEIIESHGGAVSAERCTTGGSIFCFSLPLADHI